MRRNTRAAVTLNGRHQGETVFVIGSGPQLNRLSEHEKRALADSTAIALNRVQYAVPTRYFVSAYPTEVMLAHRRLPRGTVIHIRPSYEPPMVKGTVTLRRQRYNLRIELPTRLTPPEPTVFTRSNVALAATHLALIFGARRVVFVGIEQRSKLHYYDERPELREPILRDLEQLPNRHTFSTDHHYATYDKVVEALKRDPAELEQASFYTKDHTPTFAQYFEQLRQHGVEPVATTRESVIHDAGASFLPLQDALRDL